MTMELDYTVTKEQEEEFEKAGMSGGSAEEIRKHPEWHQNMMNIYWNCEKRHEEGECIPIVQYILLHPSHRDMKAKKAGADFNYLYALYAYCHAMKEHGLSTDLPEIPLREGGCVDITEACFLLQDQFYRHAQRREPLRTGRLPIGEKDNSTEMECLLCEGNGQALQIYKQLDWMAAGLARRMGDGLMPEQWKAVSLFLGMDDMNIRGRQLVDAYEYAGKSIEILYRLLSARSKDIIDYVNQCAGRRFFHGEKDGSLSPFIPQYPLAAENGASFTKERYAPGTEKWRVEEVFPSWGPQPGSLKEVLAAVSGTAKEIRPLTPSYSDLDIKDGVDEETGTKIIEARGFVEFFSRNVPSCMGSPRHAAFYYNRHNGDIVEVAGAKEDSISWSGVRLKIWRDREEWHHAAHGSSGFDHNAGIGHVELTDHEGLFAEYRSYTVDHICNVEGRKKVGYQGSGKFPIPAYVNAVVRDSDAPELLSDIQNICYLGSDHAYQLEWMIDMVLAAYDPALDEKICPDYKPLKEDPYRWFIREHGGVSLWSGGMYVKAKQFQFLASYLRMPAGEREKYFNALLAAAEECDRRAEEGKGKPAFGKAAELKDIYLSDPEHPEDIRLLRMQGIEELGYDKFLPWLQGGKEDA